MSKSPIPNLPPISGIQDPQVRAYLTALTNAWQVRNGQVGTGEEKFLTLADLKEGIAQATQPGRGGNLLTPGGGVTAPGIIAGLIQSLSDEIQQSRLWKVLGERIGKIETPDWFRARFGAEITNEEVKRVTATTVLAQQINTVSAEMGGNVAAVRNEIETVASEVEAKAQQTTQAITQLGNNQAIMQSQLTSVSNQAGATASQVSTLQVQVGTAYSSAQQALSLAANVDGKVTGTWSVKFDVNGYVTGAGLGLDGKGGNYSSQFIVRADRFAIGAPVNSAAQWNDPTVPFIVTTTATTVGGVTYPPGVWIKNAMIADASITNAKIGNAAITNAKIADAAITSAKIANAAIKSAHIEDLSVDSIKIKNGAVSDYAVSSSGVCSLFVPSGAIWFLYAVAALDASYTGEYAPNPEPSLFIRDESTGEFVLYAVGSYYYIHDRPPLYGTPKTYISARINLGAGRIITCKSFRNSTPSNTEFYMVVIKK